MHASPSTPASGRIVSQPQDVGDRLLLVARGGHQETYPNSLKWLMTILLAAAAFLDPISYTMLYRKFPLGQYRRTAMTLTMRQRPFPSFQRACIRLQMSQTCLQHSPLSDPQSDRCTGPTWPREREGGSPC